jgi:hypothetical protein
LFEVSTAPVSKPFLAAALKAKEDAGGLTGHKGTPIVDLEVFNDISSSSKSCDENEDSSLLCSSELDELDELFDREDKVERLSEESSSKLRDLDLFDWYKEGEYLNEDDKVKQKRLHGWLQVMTWRC